MDFKSLAENISGYSFTKVHEKDFFEYKEGPEPEIEHRILDYSDRGPVIAQYLVIRGKNNSIDIRVEYLK
jgi:hypothetical protein